MKINLFTPPNFKKHNLNIESIDTPNGRPWVYSSYGRSSIYHILRLLDINNILVPIYICSTVLEPLKRLNIEPIFYDLDTKDLNPSLDSIKSLVAKYDIKAVLVASMYGNPANLNEIEKFCKKNGIFMIDDAAQSFGAKLDNKSIGCFGDAGFFSFSPGKPTAGHMGSFFWSNHTVDIKRTKHCLVHYIKWLYFYFNRYKIYTSGKLTKFLMMILNLIVSKYADIYYDDICEFEKSILGGVLNEDFAFRQRYHNEFAKVFADNEYFRVVQSIRGVPNNHKMVICFKDKELAQEFISFMKQNEIYISNGYEMLSKDLEELPNAKKIDRRVVEMPIEDDDEKMDYLFSKVKEFDGNKTN
jgi:dTDP-4-amino-4,6-dideoxygalactose transaminase